MTELSKAGLDPLPGDDWEVRYTKQVVRNIAHYKDKLGLTTAALAERCSRVLGEPGAVRPTTLNNLLAGKRRSISVAEILTFGIALGVPAVALMVPLLAQRPVETLPGRDLLPIDFYAALVGQVRYYLERDEPGDEQAIASEALRRIRDYWNAEQTLMDNISALGITATNRERDWVPEAMIQNYLRIISDAAGEYRELRHSLEQFGIALPDPHPLIGWVLHIGSSFDITVEAVQEVWQREQERTSVG